eukprot:Cvel_35106.t1-p1 / transcript=Cvel_35106.t1 / gene=Cvel_35106 / organism=Chromera_velia_CCMP2878 / gene_product=Thrombospondin-3b, putative / transcript_product=Thrombospondin-3b, putative / location=Cvel_scaffold6284:301-3306(+) / protein_length=622 / sequence_SO=supercontig / SO=protein_coding / is_pseudo=false
MCTSSIATGFDPCAGGPDSEGVACRDDGNECTDDICIGGTCVHVGAPRDGSTCTTDGNECTADVCSGGECTHPPLNNVVCTGCDLSGSRFCACREGSCEKVSVDTLGIPQPCWTRIPFADPVVPDPAIDPTNFRFQISNNGRKYVTYPAAAVAIPPDTAIAPQTFAMVIEGPPLGSGAPVFRVYGGFYMDANVGDDGGDDVEVLGSPSPGQSWETGSFEDADETVTEIDSTLANLRRENLSSTNKVRTEFGGATDVVFALSHEVEVAAGQTVILLFSTYASSDGPPLKVEGSTLVLKQSDPNVSQDFYFTSSVCIVDTSLVTFDVSSSPTGCAEQPIGIPCAGDPEFETCAGSFCLPGSCSQIPLSLPGLEFPWIYAGNPCGPDGECTRQLCSLEGQCDANAFPINEGQPCTGGVCQEGVCVNPDLDADGVLDINDNCPLDLNADQTDSDSDGIGDVCDNCPDVPNPGQENTLGNTADPTDPGDACDRDGDGVLDVNDNCPDVPNSDQADSDGDGIGDLCNTCSAAEASDLAGLGVSGVLVETLENGTAVSGNTARDYPFYVAGSAARLDFVFTHQQNTGAGVQVKTAILKVPPALVELTLQNPSSVAVDLIGLSGSLNPAT